MSAHRPAVQLFVLFLAIAIGSSEASARYYHRRGRGGGYGSNYRRQMMINAIAGQVNYARAVLADAEARAAVAQGQVNAANQRISSARESLTSAEADEKRAHEALVEAEAAMISAAGEDSDIAKAKKALDELRQSLQYEEHRVLNSAEYLARIAKSEGTPEHATIVPKVRAEMLGSDTQYQAMRVKYEAAKHEFSHLRTEAVNKDQTWLGHSSEIKQAWTSEVAATNQGIAGGMQKLPAKQTLHEAQRTAAAARAYVAQGEMILRSLGAGNRTGGKGTAPVTTSMPRTSSNFFSQ